MISGRHKCPQAQRKGDFETSYKSQFQEIHQKVAATQPPPYVYKERHYPAEALTTRYKETFQEPTPYEN